MKYMPLDIKQTPIKSIQFKIFEFAKGSSCLKDLLLLMMIILFFFIFSYTFFAENKQFFIPIVDEYKSGVFESKIPFRRYR